VINLPTLDAIRIPWLSDLPVIGHALFDQSLLTYAAFLLVVPDASFSQENSDRTDASSGDCTDYTDLKGVQGFGAYPAPVSSHDKYQ
jgi:hypothetical protein